MDGASAQFGQSGCRTNPSVTSQRNPATDRDAVTRQSLDQAARTNLAHPPYDDAASAAKLHATFDEHRLPAADKPARKRNDLTDDHANEFGRADRGIDPVIQALGTREKALKLSPKHDVALVFEQSERLVSSCALIAS